MGFLELIIIACISSAIVYIVRKVKVVRFTIGGVIKV